MSTPDRLWARPGSTQQHARNRRRAVIARTAGPGRSDAIATPAPEHVAGRPLALTKGQTTALLALSRGDRFDLQPMMRRWFLRHALIAPVGVAGADRRYELTQRGLASLAASPWLAAAQQALDGPRRVP